MKRQLSILLFLIINTIYLYSNNYVILTNDLPIEEQLIYPNTIYEIRNLHSLKGKTLSIPNNVVLKFVGGSFSDGIISGNSTFIDTYPTKIFDNNIRLIGTWKNSSICPEWFGAKGDGVNNDTDAFKQTIVNAFNNHLKVELKSPYYKVIGNNPCGLPFFQEEANIIFFYKEGLEGDDNRSRYNLYLEGNGALIYWMPQKESDVFAFVGYLRHSVWQNLNIKCISVDNFGDVFSTNFNKPNQSHIFSGNTFRNIRISGKCRRIFSFDCVNNEIQSHDDLSIFEKISASGYVNFCYINNGNSVSNTFIDCSTCLSVNNAVDFLIDCKSWAGNLRILNHHFTIMNCNNAILVKDNSEIIRERIVYIDKPRLEVLPTASKWKYFDIKGLTLFINGLESITPPLYDKDNEYAIVRSGHAQAFISDMNNVLQPFALCSINYSTNRFAYVFNNCSFKIGNNFFDIQEFPIMKYYGKSKYSSRAAAMLSMEKFPSVKVLNSRLGESLSTNKFLSWNESYIEDNCNFSNAHKKYKRVFSTKKNIENQIYSIVDKNTSYVIPFDIVITSLSYCSNKNINLSKITMNNCDTKNENKVYEIQNNGKEIVNENIIILNKEICLPAGSKLSFSFFNLFGKECAETELGIDNSYVEIEYRHPNFIDDFKELINY